MGMGEASRIAKPSKESKQMGTREVRTPPKCFIPLVSAQVLTRSLSLSLSLSLPPPLPLIFFLSLTQIFLSFSLMLQETPKTPSQPDGSTYVQVQDI